MADYLTRLYKRTSGKIAAVKPMVRSSYGTLPRINESAEGFEETASFEGADGYTPLQPQVSQANTTIHAGKTDAVNKKSAVNPEISKSPGKPALANNITGQRPVSPALRQSGRLSREAGKISKVSANITPAGSPRLQTKPEKRNTPSQVISPSTTGITDDTGHEGGPMMISRQNIPARGYIPQKRAVNRTVPAQQGRATGSRRPDDEAPGIQPENTGAGLTMAPGQTVIPEKRVKGNFAGNTIEPRTLITEPREAPVKMGGREIKTSPNLADRRKMPSEREKDREKPAAASRILSPAPENIFTVRNRLDDAQNLAALKNRESVKYNRREYSEKVKSQPAAASDAMAAFTEAPDGVYAGNRSRYSAMAERPGPAETGRQMNIVRQPDAAEIVTGYMPDSLPGRNLERDIARKADGLSQNIRVTIGRVEIQAVQEQERRASRPVSGSRKPAISLDAYLKARNEEKR